ncbi:uncharacterized [Tachysurus ichikawai]
MNKSTHSYPTNTSHGFDLRLSYALPEHSHQPSVPTGPHPDTRCQRVLGGLLSLWSPSHGISRVNTTHGILGYDCEVSRPRPQGQT